MVIDAAVLLAILRGEPDGPALQNAILNAPTRLISAVTRLEAAIAATGVGDPGAADDLDDLLAELSVSVMPFDEAQADIARDAFARFGKGRHPANLNFGDCAAYALAIAEAEPLLFKGPDYAATDVTLVRAG